MLAYICIHTHTSSYRRKSDDDRHTHTHAHPWSYVCTNTHTSLGLPLIALPGTLPLHTHTSSCLLEIWLTMTHTYTPIPMPTLYCLHKHIFLLHVYRSVFLARMRRYTQLAYLFHKCAMSLLSRDGRIADCTVRHPSVERPFSSLLYSYCKSAAY